MSLGQTRGRRAVQKVCVKKVYVPFLGAKNLPNRCVEKFFRGQVQIVIRVGQKRDKNTTNLLLGFSVFLWRWEERFWALCVKVAK